MGLDRFLHGRIEALLAKMAEQAEALELVLHRVLELGKAKCNPVGLKRLLEEGRVETECHYRHLNTETGPGHSSLSTGAPPRVSGIVANRWFEQNSDGSIREVGCAQQANPFPVPGSPPLFYREVPKEGRLYVFATRRELVSWEQSGEMGKAISRLAAGPNGVPEPATMLVTSAGALGLLIRRPNRRAK